MSEKNESKSKIKFPKFNSGKTYDFSLTLPGMISAVGAGVLALTFFFVMGILIGRGYRPETDMPQLDGIMPAKQHGELNVTVQEKPEILKAEELDYPERLKASPEKVMEETAPRAETKPVPKPTPPSEGEAGQDTGPEKPEVFQAPEAKSGEPVFDFIYQAASFRDPVMADNLSGKLAASGLRTNVQAGDVKGTTWYRVNVLHHGTLASTDPLMSVLRSHGIKKPFMKQKKASQ